MEDQVVESAVKALLYEVVLMPKPGLVDPSGHASHPDMNVFTFIDSSLSLVSYFKEAYQAGQKFTGGPLTNLFSQLRQLGLKAEKKMLMATKGVNTHKGAIFSLGVIVGAAGQTGQDTDQILVTVKSLLVGLTKRDLGASPTHKKMTAGQDQFQKYGLTGIRGQAEAGFPIVSERALPFLRQSQGTKEERLMDTLMLIAGHLEDSNLIKRAGNLAILPWMKKQSDQYFDLGGSRTSDGRFFLEALGREMDRKNLSLGGSADLLIITIFFGLLENIL